MKKSFCKVHFWSRALTVLYGLSLIPMLMIAWFNYPSADDFSMANEVRIRFVESGSVIQTIGEAIHMAGYYFMNWCGYYFSDFLMALPPSVFGERWYVISTFLLLGMYTVGTIFFMHAVLVRCLKVDKDITCCITMLLMLITIQCMPEGAPRVEAFYWYAGAVNYLFMYSVGLVYIGMLLYCMTESDRRSRIIQLIATTFLGFAMGGANYMSALSCAIISVLLAVWIIVRRNKKQYVVLIPIVVMLIGFAASCKAPGNAVRSAMLTSMNPIKAILISLFYTLHYAVSEWTTWPVLCLLILMVPLLWKAAGQINWDFKWPFAAIALAYGMTAANITPPVYAEGHIAGGRIQSLLWIQYILCLILLLIYLFGWVQVKWDLKKKDSGVISKNLGMYLGTVTVLFVFGSGLCIMVNPYFYTSTAALADLANGSAMQYKVEWDARYELLNDPNVQEVVVPELSVRPKLLYFSDIAQDPAEWSNTGMCEYFDKQLIYSTSNYVPMD